MSERLVILVPDGAYVEVLDTILNKRQNSLGIRGIGVDLVKDPSRDSSPDAVNILRSYLRTCTHSLVIRDLHGSGKEHIGAEALQEELQTELKANGWNNSNSAAIVVDPEIEAWLRFDSSHIKSLVKSKARRSQTKIDLFFETTCEDAIMKTGGCSSSGKPVKPKEAFEKILKEFGIQRSNALYRQLAEKESLRGCSIQSIQRLQDILKSWFPRSN